MLSKVVDERGITLLQKKKKTSSNKNTAGPAWFDMPAAQPTPELEADLRLLRMRSALDPKQHYKKGEKILQGPYYQVGTVVSDPSTFYCERHSKKKRGQTILDTLIKDTSSSKYLKSKFESLQEQSRINGRKISKRKF
jgi:hypothetical protein